QKLWQAREQRTRPGRDEKILVSWNALMIQGMARAAAVFHRADWLDSARRAMDFIRREMWQDERLLATYKDGRAHLNAYLDDYAFLLAAQVELAQADYRKEDTHFAAALADTLLEYFEATERGGLYFTSHDHEALFHRPKPAHDSAMPSGNGVAAYALQRLGFISGDDRYLAAAERTLRAFYRNLAAHPSGFASLLIALTEHLEPPRTVVLRGEVAQIKAWRDTLAAEFRPGTLIFAPQGDTATLPPALAKPLPAQGASAYVCHGLSCLAP